MRNSPSVVVGRRTQSRTRTVLPSLSLSLSYSPQHRKTHSRSHSSSHNVQSLTLMRARFSSSIMDAATFSGHRRAHRVDARIARARTKVTRMWIRIYVDTVTHITHHFTFHPLTRGAQEYWRYLLVVLFSDESKFLQNISILKHCRLFIYANQVKNCINIAQYCTPCRTLCLQSTSVGLSFSVPSALMLRVAVASG